jgi:hypothetical protein
VIVKPSHVLLIDIDGLRADVFSNALAQERIPHIARLLGTAGLEWGVGIPALAPAPSITFTSQASLFTGAHPSQHGIPGNQFFDRFGQQSQGVPRHYAFDVGDTLAADDAVRVFTDGLAARCLSVPTLYSRLNDWGYRSVVGGNMYATGADAWLKPSLTDLARFTKGGNLFGLSSEEYDRQILEKVLEYLKEHGLPVVLTVYFMGLDHESHLHGPNAQSDYLIDHLDGMIGELWQAILELGAGDGATLVIVFSDHGQIGVVPDDRHSLRLAFPIEREIGHLFDALGLDVHDYPGEDPNCDAVVACNGGLAHVYLQNRRERWADPPDFKRDVLTVGGAFWEAHDTGRYASEIEGALAGVLLRDVQGEGWFATYRALTPGGQIVSLAEWFASQPEVDYIDPVHRLNNLASPVSGDLLLISNYPDGFYFASPMNGVHGGLHPDDSRATLYYGWPGVDADVWHGAKRAILEAIAQRCQVEGERKPSTADLLTGLLAVIN